MAVQGAPCGETTPAEDDGAAPMEAQSPARPLKITVVTTVYNDVRVGRALESILCQQHDCTLELIVIDAGSKDGTLNVLERYRDRVLVHMALGGASTGKLRGIMKAHREATRAWRKNGLWGRASCWC